MSDPRTMPRLIPQRVRFPETAQKPSAGRTGDGGRGGPRGVAGKWMLWVRAGRGESKASPSSLAVLHPHLRESVAATNILDYLDIGLPATVPA